MPDNASMFPGLSPRETVILNLLSPNIPITRRDIQKRLEKLPEFTGVSDHSIYRTLQTLIDKGFAAPASFRRGKEMQYVSAIPDTKMFHMASYDSQYTPLGQRQTFPITAFASASETAYEWRFTTPTAELIGEFHLVLLNLAGMAARAANGEAFEKANFQGARGKLLEIRARAAWLADSVDALLSHQSMVGSPQDFIDSWALDPEHSLTLEEVRRIEQVIATRHSQGAPNVSSQGDVLSTETEAAEN